MSWMQTFTGRRFTPIDPQFEDISINDIGHSLSNMCRFAGHCISFYSVAQHSVLVSLILKRQGADARTQLRGLLHDATEAYLVDVPTPVKRHPIMRDYRAAEKILEDAVARRFGFSEPLVTAPVKSADAIALVTEARDLMGVDAETEWKEFGYEGIKPMDEKIETLLPEKAKELFMMRYIELIGAC